MRRIILALSLSNLCLAPASGAALGKKKIPADPFCVSPQAREEQKAKLKEKISRSNCSSSLRKLKLARLDCSDPQSIRDFKSAVLGSIRPDDAFAEGFARALCPGKADAACMNLEPQCRLTPFPGDPGVRAGTGSAGAERFRAAKKKFFLDRLKDINEEQARTLVDHYLELNGSH